MASKHGLTLVLVVFATTLAGSALCEPTAASKEMARTLMDEGRARSDRGNHTGALESFQGADAVMHVPTTGLEVAHEQVALGQLLEARDTLLRVIRSPAKEGEPEPFRMARTNAQALDDELASRIPALQLTVIGTQDVAQVAVDGLAVPAVAMSVPVKVNPGHHVVIAKTASALVREETTIMERETKPLVLRFLASGDVASGDADHSEVAADAPVQGHSKSGAWLKWGGFGLAAVGVAVGTVTGVMSLSSTSAAKNACVDNKCPPSSWSDIDSAHTTATVSTVAFIAAGVGATLGVVGLLVGRTKHEPAPPAVVARARPTVTPWLGAGAAGLTGTF